MRGELLTHYGKSVYRGVFPSCQEYLREVWGMPKARRRRDGGDQGLSLSGLRAPLGAGQPAELQINPHPCERTNSRLNARQPDAWHPYHSVPGVVILGMVERGRPAPCTVVSPRILPVPVLPTPLFHYTKVDKAKSKNGGQDSYAQSIVPLSPRRSSRKANRRRCYARRGLLRASPLVLRKDVKRLRRRALPRPADHPVQPHSLTD
jgi:hypothetical protein